MKIAITGKLHSYHNETIEEAFAKGELAAVSDDLPQLLGRAPLNFEDVVRAQYAK
jgi:nmrA family protein